MRGYLIYHPTRKTETFEDKVVYFDDPKNGNQDPYVWNTQFLHTFCHMAEVRPRPAKDDIIFWVSRDRSKPEQLLCDLVFVVGSEPFVWGNANAISRQDPIVDSEEAWNDHYRWGNLKPDEGHYYSMKQRFTLKADPHKSFQPQLPGGGLIDIAPFLLNHGFCREQVWNKGARPRRIDEAICKELYQWISARAELKLYGKDLEPIRRETAAMASQAASNHASCGSRQSPSQCGS